MTKQDFINVLRLINGCVALTIMIAITFFIATESKLTIESWADKHFNLLFSFSTCFWIAVILPPFKTK